MKIGFHISIAGSIDKAVDRAIKKDCDVFQIFSRNPRSWKSRKLLKIEIEDFKRKLSKSKIWPVFIHTPYLLNLASPKKRIYSKSIKVLKDELRLATKIGIPYIVTHLGSHLGTGKQKGFQRVINALNKTFLDVETNASVLLENTAGTKNSIGSYFEDLKQIISGITFKERIGICFDTCHAFAAGYNLISKESITQILTSFNEEIGVKKIKLVHLNDSKGELGSKIDRHEHIGIGKIGEKGLINILKSKLGQLPLILETPIDGIRKDIDNLKKIRKLLE